MLVREYPAVPAYRSSLATAQLNMGEMYFGAGRLDRAEAVTRDALATAESLVREYPSVSEFVSRLAMCCGNLGLILAESRPAEALGWFSRAIGTLETAREGADQG